MNQSPSAALLRLREADVVRFCGLAAAARGLESVAQHAVTQGQRAENWLSATVSERETMAHAWAEAIGSDPLTIRWRCSCRTMPEAAPIPPLACEHVAALLTAWIRDPASFTSFTTVTSSANDSGNTNRTADAPEDTARPAVQPPRRPLIEQPPLLRAPRAHRPHGEPTLAEELARLSTSDLLAVMRRVLGMEDTSPEARKLLENTLCTPQKLAALIARLDQQAQTLLAEVLLLGGSSTSADLDAIAIRSEQAPGALKAALAVLERHALMFPAPGIGGTPPQATEQAAQGNATAHPWRQVAGWRIPPEIRAACVPALPIASLPARAPHGPPLLEPTPPPSAPSAKALRVVRATPRQLVLALALLAYGPALYNPVHPQQSGTQDAANLDARSMRTQQTRRASPVPRAAYENSRPPFPLVPGDLPPQMTLEFARGAGLPAGLAQMARRVLLWAREQGGAPLILDLARLPEAEGAVALKSAFTLWHQAELPVELADLALPGSPIQARFDQRHEALRPAALAADVFEARRFLLGVLRRAQPDTWYALDALLALLWRIHPGFLRGRQQAYTTPAWWLEQTDRRRPLRITVREEWFAAEGAYVQSWLTGPLHWWGVCDLAMSNSGQPLAFRLTPLGAYLLSAGDVSDVAAPSIELSPRAEDWGAPLLVTRDGRLAVQPLAAGAPLLDALATWARPVSIAGGRIVYTFDAGLAATAFDHGLTPDHLLKLLQSGDTSAGKRALAAAQAQCSDWQARYGASRITTGWALVEARDEATLSEALASAPEIAAQCRRVSPAHVLVPPEVADALEAALRRRGYHV